MSATNQMTAPRPADEFVRDLLRVPAQERAALILGRLREELAGLVNVRPEALQAASPIPRIRLADGSLTVHPQALQVLQTALHRSLRVQIYLQELNALATLGQLVAYLAPEFEAPPATGGAPEIRPWPHPWSGSVGGPPVSNVALILSSPRSGSTLLRAMLHGHPRLFAPPELNLMAFETMGQRAHWFSERGCGWLAKGLVTALAAAHRMPEAAARDQIRQWETTDTPVIDVYRSLVAGCGPALLVDKSPLYATHDGCILSALAHFENVRLIHLVRHPHAVIESLVRMRFARVYAQGWPGWSPSPWRYADNVWWQANENIRTLLEQAPPGSQCTVRFEDLLARPAEVAADVCRHLGVDYHPGVLTPYDGNRLASTGASAGPTLGDPNFLQHGRIESERATEWRTIRLPFPMTTHTRELAARFGYDPV